MLVLAMQLAISHTQTPTHALQRQTPALLASAGPRLLVLAAVSGWITACSWGTYRQ